MPLLLACQLRLTRVMVVLHAAAGGGEAGGCGSRGRGNDFGRAIATAALLHQL